VDKRTHVETNKFKGTSTTPVRPRCVAIANPARPTMKSAESLARKPEMVVKVKSESNTRIPSTAIVCLILSKREGLGGADDLVGFDSAMRSCSWFKKRVSSLSMGAFSSTQARYAVMSGLWAGAKLLLALLYVAIA
jgi:hypothetical protein